MDIKVNMQQFNNKDWWEYLDQIIFKGSVGIPRSSNAQGIGGSN